MFKLLPSKINGCFVIEFRKMSDNRGHFTKTFHEGLSAELGINTLFSEEYFSVSARNVFRGMHFQVPPKAIDKTIFCAEGRVTDYVVDIRQGSPTYGEWDSFELDAETPRAVFVPRGLAHGFFTRSETAVMQCKSSGVYDAPADVTVSYKSFGFAREIVSPILSEKDIQAVPFDQFNNPFRYQK